VAVVLRRTRAQLELTLREMQHRGKNTFAVVDGIIRRSLHEHPGLAETVSARVQTVSSTNDLIAKSDNLTVELDTLIRAKLAAFDCTDIDGPNVKLTPDTARTFSLLIHELCTNAVKYGGLSAKAGTVSVHWQIDHGMLHLVWEERGGPAIQPPETTGFGSKLLKSLAAHMGGHYSTEFGSSGLIVKLSVRI